MSRHGVSALFVVLFGAAFLAVPLSAQITGSVHGSAVDPAGATVAQGTATIKNLETGGERAPQQLTSGAFTFDLLQIGNYQVRVEAPGFRPATADVEVKAGEISNVRMALTVGALTESVTVIDTVAALDTENSQIQISYTGPRVQEI